MRIAIPVADNVVCSHFGHCEAFAVMDVDPTTATITSRQDMTPPHHAPGVYPAWLAEQQVTLVLAGGMGGRARDLFAASNIQVIVGIGSGDPESVVTTYLAGQLVEGENACNHGSQPHTCDH